MKSGKGNKGLFIKLSHGMIDSPAFHALPPLAVTLYVHIAKRYNGHNNGDISFSVREAGKALGVSKDTAGTLFHSLIEKGFLKVTAESGFNYKQQNARRFELTQWPLRNGVAPSNDWRFWNPAKEKEIENGEQV